MPTLTARAAQGIQDQVTARGGWVMWFVQRDGQRWTAWALVADTAGGRHQGELVAGTLEELRALLPRGLTRRERTSFMARDVVETWD